MFNLLYTSNEEMQILGLSLGILLVILVVSIIIEIAFIVASVNLANKKGRSGALWGWATVLFGIVALIVLACLPDIYTPTTKRTSSYAWTCKYCGHLNFGNNEKCSNCKTSRTTKQAQVIHPVSAKGWTCPNCGEENNSNAKNCINCFEKRPD